MINAALDVVLNERSVYLPTEHDDPDCCCWDCILALHCEVVVRNARRAVELSDADSID